MVGVGQVTLPDHGGGQFGAVAGEDVGEHGDRLALAGAVRLGAERRCWRVTSPFPPDTLVTVQFWGGAGAGLWVGRLARVVNTYARFTSVPRVMAGYSHCRSSVPVTRAMPVCTVAPWAECPVTA